MPRNGRPKPEDGPARELRPVEPASPIVDYRPADIPEILGLYLNAVEAALKSSTDSASVPADDGRRRAGAGKPPTWHPV